VSTHPISGFDLETVDRLLTTTRAVRRRLDFSKEVPLQIVKECLELAIQAPTGSNTQFWRWIVVTDPATRTALGELYRNPPAQATRTEPQLPSTPQQQRMMASAHYLMEHITEVPLFVLPCILDSGGAAGWPPSIYPAVWSFMLALRSRGLGSVITTAHLYRRDEAAALLGIPGGYVQACLLPVAYYTGTDFKPAVRRPIDEVCFLNRWDEPLPAT
jgi:nitroreductase